MHPQAHDTWWLKSGFITLAYYIGTLASPMIGYHWLPCPREIRGMDGRPNEPSMGK
uniref:Uncharacterized protein n=1 Tax=Candidatus Kentrum sp. LFY TaxID=2126342 RepID=A0A450WXC2_9GAMM|nr:MAG: hypothetical protein BECKLFY1418C_GA0070996_109911 [Candidatus Kentron sp. LFY]